MATPNLMVYGKVTLLGTELDAGLLSADGKTDIFVKQDLSTPPAGLTIKQMIEELNTYMKGSTNAADLTTDHFEKQLTPLKKDPAAAFDPGALRLILKTVYLHIHEESGKKTIEYAFRVDLDATDVFKSPSDLFKIERLTLAVWNTDNDKFTAQMALPVSP